MTLLARPRAASEGASTGRARSAAPTASGFRVAFQVDAFQILFCIHSAQLVRVQSCPLCSDGHFNSPHPLSSHSVLWLEPAPRSPQEMVFPTASPLTRTQSEVEPKEYNGSKTWIKALNLQGVHTKIKTTEGWIFSQAVQHVYLTLPW
ncbi:hypothetical protein PVAP13_2KG196156 [Panicum virgatum]|uniref:Uncharacterized protein n=1 Tax=Panicum virgatum TaxID=38727 RepID=A0A8T0W5G1_PANVG|nr:hypothetical protein PVAP13_2KG196156 [Panicum virgatum]